MLLTTLYCCSICLSVGSHGPERKRFNNAEISVTLTFHPVMSSVRNLNLLSCVTKYL